MMNRSMVSGVGLFSNLTGLVFSTTPPGKLSAAMQEGEQTLENE